MSEHDQDRERERARAKAYQDRRAAWEAHRARREELTAPTGEEVKARREAYLEHLARQEREAAESPDTTDTPTEDSTPDTPTEEHSDTTETQRRRAQRTPARTIQRARERRAEGLTLAQISAQLTEEGHTPPSLPTLSNHTHAHKGNNRGRARLYPPELVALIRRLRTREGLTLAQISARLEKLGHPAPSPAQIYRYLSTATSRPTNKGHGSRE